MFSAALLIQPSEARECYICGIGTSDPLYDMIVADKLKQQLHPQHGATNIGHKNTSDARTMVFDSPVPSCTQFAEQSAENISKFVVQCPVGYMGCLTQWDGKCSGRYRVHDCI